MRILESQRHKILDQLEKCPSSGDEAESPKKRAKYSQEIDDHHHNNHHDPSTTTATPTTNCNGKVLDHREHSVAASYSTYNHHRYHHNDLAHRKTVEIRRLSDCNIKHSASVPGGAMTQNNYTKPSRRPSTDSLTRYSTTPATTQMENYHLHKRRKTSAGASTSSSSSSMTANEIELKSRTHQIQSFDASGGESEHGSRPDTPLFDERPDNAPADPRTNRPRLPREPLNLPLPKFAQGFHQQLRQTNQLLPASHAIISNAEKYENTSISSAFSHHHHHSSLKNKSISPSPQHHPVRSRSNSLMPPVSSGSSVSETLLTSPRPPSLTSNSSDSEQELSSIAGPSTSPSLEERLKKLSEDYDSWSSNGRSSSSSHYMNNNMRHAVPEIPIPETPELLLKNVLKNSMFDEDSKRLENINTQPPTTPCSSSNNAKGNFGTFNSNHLSVSGTSSPLINMSTIVNNPILISEHSHSPALSSSGCGNSAGIPIAIAASTVTLGKVQIPTQQPVITTMLQHRLGSSSGSPMHSPNTASPYNSPNPSSASSISSLKGLQYPFPSHTTSTTTNTTNSSPSISNNNPLNVCPSTASTSATTISSSSSTSSSCATSTIVSTSSHHQQQQQKPKTCTLSKSVSLQEVVTGANSTSSSSSSSSSSATTTTGNNNLNHHNNNNFNTSFNKSSTNNVNSSNNNNNSNDNPTTTTTTSSSKQLMKSVSFPSCGATLSSETLENVKNDKIDESKNENHEPLKNENHTIKCDDLKKEQHEIGNEKKNHAKDRRKNCEQQQEEVQTSRDEVKEHSKKDGGSFRKDKESKRIRDKETTTTTSMSTLAVSANVVNDEKKTKTEVVAQKMSKKSSSKDENCDDKKEELFERAPSPNALRNAKRRTSTDDLSSIDSSVEISSNHVENNKNHEKKENKHHDSNNKTNSKHHHHSTHKDRKNSMREKLHSEDDSHAKSKQSDLNSSKDSIFDELKRNTKDNIIKTNEKVHKNKKHHHHHRDNGNKDKENQTQQVHHYNNDNNSSAIITDDVINRSSEDEGPITLKHNHNGSRKKEDVSDDNDHDDSSAGKKHDSEHHSKSSADENHSGRKKYPRRNHNASISTDDSDESDGGTKRSSFFDILDDGPNISMYDKVKARSCKNLKKQEEEKKIKDKFTALKQSRAKREKKRLNTSEEDSDSDIHDTNSNDMFQNKFKKSHLSGSDDDNIHDSDDEILSKKSKIRNQLSICDDDESSESGINVHDGHRKRNKFFNRKISRTNVIDSSDEEMHIPSKVENETKMIEIKQEPSSAIDSFDELKKPEHEVTKNNNKHSSKKRHHEKPKEDKANKKSKKISKDHHRKSTSSTDSMQKREEDIFGSVSEEDQQHVAKVENKTDIDVVITDIKKEKIDEPIVEESSIVEMPATKERQREESKKRKEKRERRREREKQRIIKEEENSVDLDEAGRALEAQLLMSDSDHKINNNEINKELKTDDVFQFTDDEIKRDHHDSIKKKKKKKRTKEDRKHHHNHHHYESIKQEPIIDANMESVGVAFNNNNNTKMKLDVVVDEMKPSVPSLIDEVVKIDQPQPPSISSPQLPAALLSPVLKKDSKVKPDIQVATTIPGFGGVPIDETVHENAVKSIAAELEKKPIAIKEEVLAKPVEVVHEKKILKPEADKPEEKSRVVISQEETEDAVAALLGESFSMTHEDYNDPYDVPIVTTEEVEPVEVDENIIPPEEDEEMKKAIMSLNSEIDRKVDTPQSEHDLQIDTDTEEPVEDENLSGTQTSFDEPPKTPEINLDVAQIEKDKLDTSDVSDKSLKIDEDPQDQSPIKQSPIKQSPIKLSPIKVEKLIVEEKSPKKVEVKIVEKPKETEYVPEVPKQIQPPTILHRFHPTSITIPTEQAIERSSPRKHQTTMHSPSAIKSSPYSPITPCSGGKDLQINIFNQIPNAQKMSPTISPLIATTNIVPKIIGIPGKNDTKPILIHSPGVKISSQIQQQPPKIISETIKDGPLSTSSPQPSSIQVIPKYIPVAAAERKMEPKPVPKVLPLPTPIVNQQNVARPPQIIYPTMPEVKTNSQWQSNVNSVIQKVIDVKPESETILKIVEKPIEKKEIVAVQPVTSSLDTSHEEDDVENSTDTSIEKESSGKKNRGAGKQRGRKALNAQSPPQQPILEEIPSSPQTRRGGKTAAVSKRGRGGKTTNAKPIPLQIPQTQSLSTPNINPHPIVLPQSTMPPQQTQSVTGMRQQKNSESDVYEFHDDSGEEQIKSGDQRPRLIMTIKSTAATSTTASQPIVTQSTIIQSPHPNVVINASTPSVLQPSVTPISSTTVVPTSYPGPQISEAHDLAIPKSPSQHQVQSPAQAHGDEFAQPSNTRKSKRLLEKDGPRTSIDDTIDDVIRNSIPSNQAMSANARTTRVTRQNAIPQAINVPTTSSNNNINNAASIISTQQQVSVPTPPQLQQVMTPIQIENKKQARSNKKQKDRKTSETSESETEKKNEKPLLITPPPLPSIASTSCIQPQISQVPIQPQQHHIINIDSNNLPPPQGAPVHLQIPEQPKIIQIPTSVPQIIKQSHELPPPTHIHPQNTNLNMNMQKKEGTELLQLIDPVTGELQKMTQSKEGQYVPVSENRALIPHSTTVPPSTTVVVSQPAQSIIVSQPQQIPSYIDAKQQQEQEKKILSIPTSHNVIKASSPVVIEPPPKTTIASSATIISEQSHVIKPVITQNPQSAAYKPIKNQYIYNTHGIPKPPVSIVNTSAIPNNPTTVISSQANIVKMNVPSGIVQPSTIYNLPNIMQSHNNQPTGINTKYVTQPPMSAQKTIVMQPHGGGQPTIIHPTQQQTISSLQSPQTQVKPQIIHQKIPSNVSSQPQIVIHPQMHPQQQQQHPSNNLMINIPSSASISNHQSIPSPSRMTVKQVIQRTIPAQVHSPQMPPSGTVVVKATHQQPTQQHHTIVQSSQEASKAPTRYIPPGTKLVEAPIGYTAGNREVIFVEGKHTMYPNYQAKYTTHQQPIPSPTQSKPPQQIVQIQQQQMPSQQSHLQQKIIEKIPGQPQVSIQHIPMSNHQQKVYQVISTQPQSQQQQVEAIERQQWVTHEKINQQPLKTRYMEYEEAQRMQQQQQQVTQASAHPRKQAYVIETHPSSQPAHHPPTIVTHQGKTIIGLNQAPQILTGAVASPPLKAHMSQQPIVTGKKQLENCGNMRSFIENSMNFAGASSSRITAPPISPKDLPQRHYAPEAYEEVMVSFIENLFLIYIN